MKIGLSKDIHKIEYLKDNKVTLAGHKFYSDFNIIADSDGDIIIHTVSEAILGALGKSDIGWYFNKEDFIQNKSSIKILKFAISQMHHYKYKIQNLDVQIVLDKFFLKKHISEIKKSLSIYMDIIEENISIKLTSSDGKNKGYIECIAIILLNKI